MNYWLFKSEPEAFSIDDLIARPKKTEPWDGVRNYQARNMLRDDVKKGDRVFFYHSNCKVPGIVGVMEVVKSGYPDVTAFDPESKYYDPKSTTDNPRWYRVDVKFVEKYDEVISLECLKHVSALENMPLVRKGNRLSIMPVTKKEWDSITQLLNEE
ncbi:MAG: EVE domain-containing protein [Gammaproteobacteria bacterium]